MNPMKTKLLPLIGSIDQVNLRRTCEALVDSPRYADLAVTPAALTWHHNYEGGLLAHTHEVTTIALASTNLAIEINRDVLAAACLWHDIGKLWEYEKHHALTPEERPEKRLDVPVNPASSDAYAYWVTGHYYKQIYHIQGSMAEFHAVALWNQVPTEIMQAVEHAILAHHGPVKDWGSPVAPQTAEALILHHADMLSSKFGPTMKAP